MRSWLSTFRKPELPPVGDLAHRIVQASLNDAEALKSSILSKDDKDRTRCWILVVCEFLYFFMHLTNRFAYRVLGHEQRCKLQDQLYPLVIRPTIESIFEHGTPDLKDRLENDFIQKLSDAELEYGECKQLLDPNQPLAQDALFSRFAGNVCALLGVEKSDPAAYADTLGKVMELALRSFNQLNLPETLQAVGKGL
jgi:hypothetical protein